MCSEGLAHHMTLIWCKKNYLLRTELFKFSGYKDKIKRRYLPPIPTVIQPWKNKHHILVLLSRSSWCIFDAVSCWALLVLEWGHRNDISHSHIPIGHPLHNTVIPGAALTIKQSIKHGIRVRDRERCFLMHCCWNVELNVVAVRFVTHQEDSSCFFFF